MILLQRRAIAGAVALLATMAILLPAMPLRAAPLNQIPVTVATTLAPNKAYTFQFSLYTAKTGGAKVWGPGSAALTVAADKTINYTLGVKPAFGASVDFSQQLWLQVAGGGKTWRVQLAAAPYALWSPASEIPGPPGPPGNDGAQGPRGSDGADGAQGPRGSDGADGLACWDSVIPNGVCDPGEDVASPAGCDALDCRGAKGDPGFTLSCQNGQTLIWSATAGAWECSVGSDTCTTYYKDADHDGAGVDGDSICEFAPSGLYSALAGGDSNDGDCLISPDMVWFLNSRGTTNPEWCLNGGSAVTCDIYFQSLGAGGTTVNGWFDRDGDGYVTTAVETLPIWFGSCLAGATPSAIPATNLRGDCDNLDPSIKPGAAEICDGIDQDCDGQVDEGVCL